LGSPPNRSHGNEVLLVIIGKDGLSKDAPIYYYGIADVLEILLALLKTAYEEEAPGVVACSVNRNINRNEFLKI
jgi:hypothetical protein